MVPPRGVGSPADHGLHGPGPGPAAHVLAIRSERESLFTQGLGSNLPLLGAVVLTVLLQMGTIYVPVLNGIFKTDPLSLGELALTCVLASAERSSRPRQVDARPAGL